jgi:hypothetical protein
MYMLERFAIPSFFKTLFISVFTALCLTTLLFSFFTPNTQAQTTSLVDRALDSDIILGSFFPDCKPGPDTSTLILFCLKNVINVLFIIGIMTAVVTIAALQLGVLSDAGVGQPVIQTRKALRRFTIGLLLLGAPGLILNLFNAQLFQFFGRVSVSSQVYNTCQKIRQKTTSATETLSLVQELTNLSNTGKLAQDDSNYILSSSCLTLVPAKASFSSRLPSKKTPSKPQFIKTSAKNTAKKTSFTFTPVEDQSIYLDNQTQSSVLTSQANDCNTNGADIGVQLLCSTVEMVRSLQIHPLSDNVFTSANARQSGAITQEIDDKAGIDPFVHATLRDIQAFNTNIFAFNSGAASLDDVAVSLDVQNYLTKNRGIIEPQYRETTDLNAYAISSVLNKASSYKEISATSMDLVSNVNTELLLTTDVSDDIKSDLIEKAAKQSNEIEYTIKENKAKNISTIIRAIDRTNVDIAQNLITNGLTSNVLQKIGDTTLTTLTELNKTNWEWDTNLFNNEVLRLGTSYLAKQSGSLGAGFGTQYSGIVTEYINLGTKALDNRLTCKSKLGITDEVLLDNTLYSLEKKDIPSECNGISSKSMLDITFKTIGLTLPEQSVNKELYAKTTGLISGLVAKTGEGKTVVDKETISSLFGVVEGIIVANSSSNSANFAAVSAVRPIIGLVEKSVSSYVDCQNGEAASCAGLGSKDIVSAGLKTVKSVFDAKNNSLASGILDTSAAITSKALDGTIRDTDILKPVFGLASAQVLAYQNEISAPPGAKKLGNSLAGFISTAIDKKASCQTALDAQTGFVRVEPEECKTDWYKDETVKLAVNSASGILSLAGADETLANAFLDIGVKYTGLLGDSTGPKIPQSALAGDIFRLSALAISKIPTNSTDDALSLKAKELLSNSANLIATIYDSRMKCEEDRAKNTSKGEETFASCTDKGNKDFAYGIYKELGVLVQIKGIKSERLDSLAKTIINDPRSLEGYGFSRYALGFVGDYVANQLNPQDHNEIVLGSINLADKLLEKAQNGTLKDADGVIGLAKLAQGAVGSYKNSSDPASIIGSKLLDSAVVILEKSGDLASVNQPEVAAQIVNLANTVLSLASADIKDVRTKEYVNTAFKAISDLLDQAVKDPNNLNGKLAMDAMAKILSTELFCPKPKYADSSSCVASKDALKIYQYFSANFTVIEKGVKDFGLFINNPENRDIAKNFTDAVKGLDWNKVSEYLATSISKDQLTVVEGAGVVIPINIDQSSKKLLVVLFKISKETDLNTLIKNGDTSGFGQALTNNLAEIARQLPIGDFLGEDAEKVVEFAGIFPWELIIAGPETTCKEATDKTNCGAFYATSVLGKVDYTSLFKFAFPGDNNSGKYAQIASTTVRVITSFNYSCPLGQITPGTPDTSPSCNQNTKTVALNVINILGQFDTKFIFGDTYGSIVSKIVTEFPTDIFDSGFTIKTANSFAKITAFAAEKLGVDKETLGKILGYYNRILTIAKKVDEVGKQIDGILKIIDQIADQVALVPNFDGPTGERVKELKVIAAQVKQVTSQVENILSEVLKVTTTINELTPLIPQDATIIPTDLR